MLGSGDDIKAGVLDGRFVVQNDDILERTARQLDEYLSVNGGRGSESPVSGGRKKATESVEEFIS
jgi:3-hydroxyisobutyrate dehydrogenase-like beta-hydroxyacid dehydrogenase